MTELKNNIYSKQNLKINLDVPITIITSYYLINFTILVPLNNLQEEFKRM